MVPKDKIEDVVDSFRQTLIEKQSFASGEVGVGLMVWFNVIILLIMSPVIKKVHDDYHRQRKAGIRKPIFDPEKLGIKNADIWMEINKNEIKK